MINRSSLRPLRTRRFAPALPAAVAAKETHTVRVSSRESQQHPARKTLSALGAVCLAFAASSASYGSPADNAPEMTSAQKSDAVIVRGRYLVEHVGLCADCHTPRNEKGEFVRNLWLKGAPLGMKPLFPMPWAPAAPPLAGLPTMNEAQARIFLTTGKRHDGSRPLPPMPEYRFGEDDATAVVAYLKSLAK
ncbi:MAG: c-type cytochrome [Verrucomicrobiota bacterium]